ncbi:MAG: hypothetical protein ACXVXP_12470 [Mycobacteriaceae bacterium]
MSTPSGQSTPPAPEVIERAARAVASSLTALSGHRIVYQSSRPCPDVPQQHSVDFYTSGEVLSVFAFDDSVSSSAMAMLDSLTDLLSERYWGEPIPSCPGHAHPLRAVSDESGVVTWVCPRDGRSIARVWPPPT